MLHISSKDEGNKTEIIMVLILHERHNFESEDMGKSILINFLWTSFNNKKYT